MWVLWPYIKIAVCRDHSGSLNFVTYNMATSPRNQFYFCLETVLQKYDLGIHSLKPEQEEALLHILDGKNTLCVLPTGYGKSLIFTIAPLLLDEVGNIYL
jgi:superfamily II DNA helicase RecQ